MQHAVLVPNTGVYVAEPHLSEQDTPCPTGQKVLTQGGGSVAVGAIRLLAAASIRTVVCLYVAIAGSLGATAVKHLPDHNLDSSGRRHTGGLPRLAGYNAIVVDVAVCNIEDVVVQ